MIVCVRFVSTLSHSFGNGFSNFSEEVFDFDGEMTQAKAHHLKKTFCSEFQAVFNLCYTVMVMIPLTLK